MSVSLKFVECTSPSYESIDCGEKKTFYNKVINVFHCLHFTKEDNTNQDTDSEGRYIKNTAKFIIYFRMIDTELKWIFITKEERDLNYDKLVLYYADRIKKE